MPSLVSVSQSLFSLTDNNLWIIAVGCATLNENLSMIATQSLSFPSALASWAGAFASQLYALFGLPLLTTLAIAPSLASERILGMQPITFACLAIPIIVQAVILLIWAVKWRSPD